MNKHTGRRQKHFGKKLTKKKKNGRDGNEIFDAKNRKRFGSMKCFRKFETEKTIKRNTQHSQERIDARIYKTIFRKIDDRSPHKIHNHNNDYKDEDVKSHTASRTITATIPFSFFNSIFGYFFVN